MGDSVKNWMAGIAAAVVVIVIAVISMGRMDRKATPKIASSNNAVTPAAITPKATSPAAPVSTQGAPAGSTAPIVSAVQLASSKSIPAQVAAAAKQQPTSASRAQVRTQPPSTGSPTTAPSQAEVTQSAQASSQPPTQLAPSQPPSSPPDTATPPDQLAAPVNAVPVQVDLANRWRTTGNVNFNGGFINSSTFVNLDDSIVTPGQNGALVTGPGNAIALGANAQFTARPNAFSLDSGASNINTSTGLETKVKEYRIRPVDPKLDTHYEVNWESDGVYVYARTHDVEIIGPCDHHWTLEEGKAVRIPDPHRCGGLIWLNSTRTWPYKVVYGAAVGAGVGVMACLYLQNHSHSMSASGPCE